ncbi:hypothetical protein ACOME3_008073 [Neoechinorhynchus agilis]
MNQQPTNGDVQCRFIRVPLLFVSDENGAWIADDRIVVCPIRSRRRHRPIDLWRKVRNYMGMVVTTIGLLATFVFLFYRFKQDLPLWSTHNEDLELKCCKKVTCADEIIHRENFMDFDNEDAVKCGKRLVAPIDMALISGGTEVSPNAWPWQVYIIQDYIGRRGKTKFCGGVIVKNHFVLTAAHCFQPCYEKYMKRMANTLSVFVPVLTNAHSHTTSFRKFKVCNVHMHDKFNPMTLTNDIALLYLCDSISMVDAVPVCLPNRTSSDIRFGKGGMVVGWGSSGESTLDRLPLQRPLRQLETFLQDPSVCFHFFRSYFDHRSQLCAKSPGYQAPCQGDSGGPLLFETDGIWRIHGIVSYGFGCGSNYHPDVYTSVGAYRQWIDHYANLLGSVYSQGNTVFNRSSSLILSPVGNRVASFDLKSNRVQTSPFQSKRNILCVDISTDDKLLAVCDEGNDLAICLTATNRVLVQHHFMGKISLIKFSPDGRKLLACHEDHLIVLECPSTTVRTIRRLVEVRKLNCSAMGNYISAEWHPSGCGFVTGNMDTTTRLIFFRNPSMNSVHVQMIPGHKWPILGCFFQSSQYDVITVDRNGQVRCYSVQRVESGEKEDIDVTIEQTIVEKSKWHTIWKIRESAGVSFNPGSIVRVSACDYHQSSQMLTAAFTDGCFVVIQMPEFIGVHSLSVTTQSPIGSIRFDSSGRWLGLASCNRESVGQLLVWDWKNETYVLKQQSHPLRDGLQISFSPDGLRIATGGSDGRVKLWSTLDGSCVTTFSDHSAQITGLVYKRSTGSVLVSCSMDGTIRAIGILEVLSGHRGPVSSVCFSPLTAFRLLSGSWDKSIRLWDIMDTGNPCESLDLLADVVCVAYRPDGLQLAASTIRAKIFLIDSDDVGGSHMQSIDCRKDVGYTGKNERPFRTLCYTLDGQYLLAGGLSHYVCIYHVQRQMLARRIAINHNYSLAGYHHPYFARKKAKPIKTNRGPFEDVYTDDDYSLPLPGTREIDNSSLAAVPELEVTCIRISPTGRSWVASTNEGVMVYSLDASNEFPFELDVSTTPEAVEQHLKKHEAVSALVKAVQLGQLDLIERIVDSIEDQKQMKIICQQIPLSTTLRVLSFLAKLVQTTRRIGHYVAFCQCLLQQNCHKLKDTMTPSSTLSGNLCELERNIRLRTKVIDETCTRNLNMLKYLNQTSRDQTAS